MFHGAMRRSNTRCTLFIAGPRNTGRSVAVDRQRECKSQRLSLSRPGQYNGVPLDNTKQYCYRILTRGAYGNPKIREPLLNFSQKLCAILNDSTPPCKPEFGTDIVASGCDKLSQEEVCSIKIFSNTIHWNRPSDPNCANDVISYNVFVADRMGDEFRKYVENVRGYILCRCRWRPGIIRAMLQDTGCRPVG